MEWIILVLIGVVAAMFGSIVGLGGGIIIVPAVLFIAPSLIGEPVDHATAVGISLTVLIITALASTLTYAKRKIVDFRTAMLFFITSGPAAIIGSAVTGYLKAGTFQLAFGIFMLLMAGLLIARDYMKPFTKEWPVVRSITDATGQTHTYSYGIVPALVIGFGVGLISGLFGIGGGSLFVPLMVLLFRFPPHIATATSMFVIFLSAILGSGMHVALGEINWLLVLALAPGAWIGGKLGAWIALRMSGKWLLWLLRVTLLLLAAQLIIEGISKL
ncbi:sulfite exporter TauE/SafE family protein [Paenibacillus sp. GSMTC-2017]|uniref:sulfite exporter TauE/SafE family protein n=1 Tax=Paenibacillus sp. GSMTC-2017 TaxID=2794350 RepID=UPI0018D78792|nr:sulfite exporter TauE/SafE family protein [Paenibacillus sp. GSMTC-2017]MBH5318955.1 sulfite exporter TauE/SafE family protein [Paenibacillus sp. GSMTC-2017]